MLRVYDLKKKSFVLEKGNYAFEFARNVLTPVRSLSIDLGGEDVTPYPEEAMKVYRQADFASFDDAAFEALLGEKIPPEPPKRPLTLESRFTDLQGSFLGNLLFKGVVGVADKQAKKAEKLDDGPEKDNRKKGALFLKRILESNSLRSMSMSAGERKSCVARTEDSQTRTRASRSAFGRSFTSSITMEPPERAVFFRCEKRGFFLPFGKARAFASSAVLREVSV